MAYGRGHRRGKDLATAISQAWYDDIQEAHCRRIELACAVPGCEACGTELTPEEQRACEAQGRNYYVNCAACSTSQF